MPTKRYTATKPTTTIAHLVGVDSSPTPVAASVATLPAQTKPAMARSTPPRYGSLCEKRLSTGLRARRHTMPRAPNSAASPVRRRPEVVVAAAHPVADERHRPREHDGEQPDRGADRRPADGRAPQPRRLPRRQRRHEQDDPGQHEQRHGGQPELARHVEVGRQGPEDVELRLDRLAPDQPADRPGDGGDEGAEHGDVEGDVEQGGDHRAAQATRAVAQEAVPRRLRVRDRRVEPVDDVGRGVPGPVVGAGQRPRRRRVVATRHGGQPARPGPSRRRVRVGRARRGRTPRRGCRRRSSTPRGRPVGAARASRSAGPAAGSASPTPCAGRRPAGRPPRRRAGRGRRRASSARPASRPASARRGCRDR